MGRASELASRAGAGARGLRRQTDESGACDCRLLGVFRKEGVFLDRAREREERERGRRGPLVVLARYS